MHTLATPRCNTTQQPQNPKTPSLQIYEALINYNKNLCQLTTYLQHHHTLKMLTRLQRFGTNPVARQNIITNMPASGFKVVSSQANFATIFNDDKRRSTQMKGRRPNYSSMRAFSSKNEKENGEVQAETVAQEPVEEVPATETETTQTFNEEALVEEAVPEEGLVAGKEAGIRNNNSRPANKNFLNNRNEGEQQQREPMSEAQIQEQRVYENFINKFEKINAIGEKDTQLVEQHIMRQGEVQSDSDMEYELRRELDTSGISILKQVLTDPDYQAKQQFLGKSSSSRQSPSIQEQKAQALNKLAAYNKSADILKVIRSRLESESGALQSYAVNELNKQGTSLGKFMANEISSEGKRTIKDIKKTSEQILKSEAQQKNDKILQQKQKPFDSFNLGTSESYGKNAFVPSNENDRLPKHDKNSISNYEQYTAYLNKIGLEAESVSLLKQRNKYDELFERYNIDQKDRKYVFWSQLEKMEPESPDLDLKLHQFTKLMNLIPEIRYEGTRPTMNDYLAERMRAVEQQELQKYAEIELARQPLIQKQLAEMKPKFDKENEGLSSADKEAAWQKVVAKVSQPIDQARIIEETQAQFSNLRDLKGAPSQRSQAVELMQDKLYQKLQDQGPLGIQRVTFDSPRDIIGDLQETMKSGPIYDMSKGPSKSVTKIEADLINDIKLQQSTISVDQYLEKAEGLRTHLEGNYDFAKRIESQIEGSRKTVAKNLMSVQGKLQDIKNKKQQISKMIESTHKSQVEQQVLPNQNLQSFIEFQESNSQTDMQRLLNEELNQLLQARVLFDQSSTDPSVYENELKVLSCHALLNEALKRPNKQLEHFSYVLGRLQANKVKVTPQIEARIFEYAVLSEKSQMAGGLLQKLTKTSSESLSPIDPRFLLKFYEQSLKQDNIDGVAYLVNYSNRFNVDLSSYPINNFRSALDYYLNKKFDLSKVMTFLKFYQRHFQDKATRQFDNIEVSQEELSDSTILSLNKQIFGQSDGLVDLPALYDHLVHQVGSRSIIDPITKEDSMWKLLESQTMDKDFIRVASMSQYSKLGGKSVAQYLGNQFGNTQSFDRTFKTALRLDDTPIADSFFNELMQQLNAYALKNENQLPGSFTEKKLSELYLRTKLSGRKISPAMSELLLFTLNRKDLHKEIIDFCTSSESQSDIQKYYLAESLLQSNLRNKTYSEALLDSQVFQDAESQDQSACELTQRTKAHFLDRSDQGAIDFFRGQLAKREEKAKQRKELMVALYDNVMGDKKQLTFDQFKQKHQQSALFSKQLVQQAYAVANLKRIVQRNDYQGIDDAFNLYMVLRQEKDLAGLTRLSAAQSKQLAQVRERKAELKHKVHGEDFYALQEIVEIAGGDKLEAADGLSQKGLNRLLDLFKDMTFDEVKEYSDAMTTEGDQTKMLSQKEQIAEMRSSLKNAKNLSDVLDTVSKKDNSIDWFKSFANDKENRYQASIQDIIMQNTKNYITGRVKDKRNDKKEKLNDRLLAEKRNEDLASAIYSNRDKREYYSELQTKAKKVLGTEQDFEEEDFYDLEQNHLENLESYIERVLDAYDEDKEQEIIWKWQLQAKLAVLANEEAQERFTSSQDGDLTKEAKQEMRNYAKTVALIRLEAKDLQDKLQDIGSKKQEAGKEKLQEYQQLYKFKYETDDEELQARIQDNEMMKNETDPKTLLNYFEQRQIEVNQTRPMSLDVKIDDSSILPDVEMFKELEQQALEEAKRVNSKATLDSFQNTENFEEENQNYRTKSKGGKGFLKSNSSTTSQSSKSGKSVEALTGLEAELRQIEQSEQSSTYEMFFFGRKLQQKEKDSEKYVHPRQMLNDIFNEDLSEGEIDERIEKGLSFGKDPEQFTSDEEDDIQEEEIMALQAEENLMEQIIKDRESIMRNPFEYSERMNVRENLDTIRSRQTFPEFREDEFFDGAQIHTQEHEELAQYNKRIRHEGVRPDDTWDPVNFMRKAHDLTLHELKEGLTKAVSDRKADALPIAIQIFNRIQDKAVKTTRLDGIADRDSQGDLQIDNISESIEKFDILLNDTRSPLISNLRSSSKYATQKLPPTLDEYRSTVKDGNIIEKPVDLNVIINDYQKMGKSEEHLKDVDLTLNKLSEMLDQKKQSLQSRAEQDSYDQWLEESKAETQQNNDEYMKRLYDEYLDETDRGDTISDESKVRLMRDAFRVELGENFINTEQGKADSSFPAFYALDFIQFGLKKEIPAAIRLGELLLSEYCASNTQASVMPRELAKAVKEYMFENQEQYQAAAKYTGPINNTQIYHQARQARTASGEQPVFVTYDDPYWKDFAAKNYRREDNWRLPSILAWEHKPHGILGEVIDFRQLDKMQRDYMMKI